MNPENENKYTGQWSTAIEMNELSGWGEKEVINTSSINDCLTDNIKTNNGTLILSRDFIRGIVESIIIKNNLKLSDTAPFMSSIEKICDQLIGPELEASYPACTLDLKIISNNIKRAIEEQLQPCPVPDHGNTSDDESELRKYYSKLHMSPELNHADIRKIWEELREAKNRKGR